ncbi:MAG TPA: hypothetical protein VJT73_18745 [Polyangiaceae bacterium]|nr:hypothetical protein [Polyangiaceae bacterium]
MIRNLRYPSDAEPIAWAVALDRAGDPAWERAPFRADWHAERATGRHSPALAAKAVVHFAPRIRCKVYFVDGKVATVLASLEPLAHSRPTGLIEASS